MFKAALSKVANERGRMLEEEGRHDEALAAYREAVELNAENSHAWFNMALVHKYNGAWEEAARCGQRAAQLAAHDYPTWWNLGIAATALGEWPLARKAWRHCGIDVPDGEGEIALPLGLVPIRIRPRESPEVVWAERIDPARARLANVPLPGSRRNWGDIVLHDGVPVGERILDGRAVPVFDELEVLMSSDLPKLEVHVVAPTPHDSHALEELFFNGGGAAEDWTRSVRHLCETCSRGSAPAYGEHEGDWRPERHFGLAAHLAEAQGLLAAWAGENDQRRADNPTTTNP